MTRLRAAVLGCALVVAVTLTSPTPANTETIEPTLRFSAAGDFGSTSDAAAVLSLIGGINNDLHLALGDNSYGVSGEEQKWCDFVKARVREAYPFQLLAGNHESNGRNGNINDFSACLPNQLPGVVGTYGRQYYVDVPAASPLVRFVMISPGLTYPDGPWSYAEGTPRYAWTAAAIDGARTAGIPWVVASVHKPCLSIGKYECDPGADITNLLVAKKVDVVLHGHEHVYQRTAQLALSTACTSITPGVLTPACIVDSDSTLVKGRGTVDATVGTGGQPLRSVNTADPEAGYFAAWSGSNAKPTYGVLSFTATRSTLSAAFLGTPGGTFTDAFTIGTTTNASPTASISSSCSSTTCQLSGAGSVDPDGTITAYRWSFGDGATATGVTPMHTFPASGTYDVTLTVTDNDGGTGSATSSVTLDSIVASDEFNRTLSSGWGTADLGGVWTTSTGAAVDGSRGTLTMAAGQGAGAALNGVDVRSPDVVAVLAPDRQPLGGRGLSASIDVRRGAAGAYRMKLRMLADGRVGLTPLFVAAAGSEQALAAETIVPGLISGPTAPVRVRVQAYGNSPTTLRAKAWAVGTAEPTAWATTLTDGTVGPQGAGSLRFYTYLSGMTSNGPVSLAVDSLSVAELG